MTVGIDITVTPPILLTRKHRHTAYRLKVHRTEYNQIYCPPTVFLLDISILKEHEIYNFKFLLSVYLSACLNSEVEIIILIYFTHTVAYILQTNSLYINHYIKTSYTYILHVHPIYFTLHIADNPQ